METTGTTKRDNGRDLLSYIIIGLFALQAFGLFYKPLPRDNERLWLEWLGARILTNGAIPHALGHEALASSGAVWIPQSWSFALFLTWCAMHGLDLLPIFIMTCIITVPLLVTYLRMKRAGAEAVAVTYAILLVTESIATRIDMRAAIVSYAAAAIIFSAINCRDSRQFVIPFTILILVNMHATAIFLAWLPALALTLTLIMQRTWSRGLSRLLFTSVASIIASFCSPFGLSLYDFAYSLTSGEIHRNIWEWTPTLLDLGSYATASQFFESILMAVLILVWCRRWSLTPADMCILASTGIMLIYAERFIPLFIIAAAPLAFRQGLRLPNLPLDALNMPLAVAGFAIMLLGPRYNAVVHHFINDKSVHISGRPGFLAPVEWLEPWRIGVPAQERVYCSNFTHCNRYLWAGASDVLDGRTDAFPIGVFHSTQRINSMHKGWQAEISKLNVNVMVIESSLPKLCAAISKLPGWHKVASTEENEVYATDSVGLGTGTANRKVGSS